MSNSNAVLLDAVLNNKAFVVTVKTSLGAEIKIYDSDTPEDSNDEENSLLSDLVDFGVTIKTKEGRQIANYGGYPQTNYILVGGVVCLSIIPLIFILRGLLKK